MRLWLLLCTALVSVVSVNAECGDATDRIGSRFDYDYKMFEKFVRIEDCNKDQDSVIRRLEYQLNGALNEIHNLNETIEQLLKERPTSTYIRWGRTTCPETGTSIVYGGYAAGSTKRFNGGGANRLCLPKAPLWGTYNDTIDDVSSGRLFGAVYGKHFEHQGKHIPCVVCQVVRQNILMIPARNVCPSGWTLEYHGYLAAGAPNEVSNSEFLCLDGDMEALADFTGSADTNRAVFHFVESRCPSSNNLKCPPYVNGRELTCAVCSSK